MFFSFFLIITASKNAIRLPLLIPNILTYMPSGSRVFPFLRRTYGILPLQWRRQLSLPQCDDFPPFLPPPGWIGISLTNFSSLAPMLPLSLPAPPLILSRYRVSSTRRYGPPLSQFSLFPLRIGLVLHFLENHISSVFFCRLALPKAPPNIVLDLSVSKSHTTSAFFPLGTP